MKPPSRRRLALYLAIKDGKVPWKWGRFAGLWSVGNRRRRRPQQTNNTTAADADWSLLPDLVLFEILRRLKTLQDFYAVRSVCRNWRNLATPSPDTLVSQSPLLTCNNSLYDVAARRFYSFRLPRINFDGLVIGYSNGHLITSLICPTDPSNFFLILRNLLTGSEILLPRQPFPFRRALLSARPDSTGCLVIPFRKSSATNIDRYLTVGDTKWTVVTKPYANYLYDMMFFRGELIVLTKDMELDAVELMGEHLRVRRFRDTGALRTREYSDSWLGEVDGEMLVVAKTEFIRNIRWSHTFQVFRWDSEKEELAEITDLGDNALFISDRNHVVAISATRLGLRNNCVYQIGDNVGQWSEFSLKDKYTKVVKIAGLNWFSPIMSTWVFPNCC